MVKFSKLICGLKVVNDIAGRRVRLTQEVKDVLTGGEEQIKLIVHCIEDTREHFPDLRKSSLAKGNRTIIVAHNDHYFFLCAGDISNDTR